MTNKITELPPRPRCQDGEYTHHWVLDPPNGPFSSGKCKICNNTYEHFPNHCVNTKWSMTGSAPVLHKIPN